MSRAPSRIQGINGASPLSQGLIGAWRYGTADLALDHVNGNNAVASAGRTGSASIRAVSPKFGTGWGFDGTADSGLIASGMTSLIAQTSNAITFGVRYKVTGNPAGWTEIAGGLGADFFLSRSGTSSAAYFRHQTSSQRNLGVTDSYQVGVAYSAVMTWDGSTLKAWALSDDYGLVSNSSAQTGTDTRTSSTIVIGGVEDNTGIWNNGEVYEVVLLNRAWIDAEVQTWLYNQSEIYRTGYRLITIGTSAAAEEPAPTVTTGVLRQSIDSTRHAYSGVQAAQLNGVLVQ